MSQHDYVIDNASALTVRGDINDAFAAIATSNSGATAPGTTYAGLVWLDTAAADTIVKIRNQADDAWITLGTLDETGDLFQVEVAAIIASQAQAEAGTNNTEVMTSLRTAQAIAALSPGITERTMQATTSGTNINYTSIPAGTSEIIMCFDGVGHDGTSNFLVRIGDAGGYESTGYQSGTHVSGNNDTATNGFVMWENGLSYGTMTLSLMDAASFRWVQSHSGYSSGGNSYAGGGSKSLSAELDRIRLTTVSGDTFDAGNINILTR